MEFHDVVEVVGFLAFSTNVAGNLMLAWQTIWGWIVRLVSISLWFVYAVYGDDGIDLPLTVNAVTFFCINLFGLWKWRREMQNRKCRICGEPTKTKQICPNHDMPE